MLLRSEMRVSEAIAQQSRSETLGRQDCKPPKPQSSTIESDQAKIQAAQTVLELQV